jgi:hypothetical protein
MPFSARENRCEKGTYVDQGLGAASIAANTRNRRRRDERRDECGGENGGLHDDDIRVI